MSLFFSLFGFSLCKGKKNAFLASNRKSQICSRQQQYRTKEKTRDNILLSEAEEKPLPKHEVGEGTSDHDNLMMPLLETWVWNW